MVVSSLGCCGALAFLGAEVVDVITAFPCQHQRTFAFQGLRTELNKPTISQKLQVQYHGIAYIALNLNRSLIETSTVFLNKVQQLADQNHVALHGRQSKRDQRWNQANRLPVGHTAMERDRSILTTRVPNNFLAVSGSIDSQRSFSATI